MGLHMQRSFFCVSLVLAGCVLLAGCGDNGSVSGDRQTVTSTDLKKPEKAGGLLQAKPTCVETRTPVEQCFKSLEEYGHWKRCVKAGGEPVKCYLKLYPATGTPRPLSVPGGSPPAPGTSDTAPGNSDTAPGTPDTPPDDPDTSTEDFAGEPGPYPATNHFQFNYIIRTLSDTDIQYLQNWGDITTLVDRQSCLFVGEVENTSHKELKMGVSRGYTRGDGVYDVDFDVWGDSPGCSGARATRFWMNFLQLRPIDSWLYPVFDPRQAPIVRVGNNNYALHDEDMFVRVRWESYDDTTKVAVGHFEFIAALADVQGNIIDTGDDDRSYVIGYYGHFQLLRND